MFDSGLIYTFGGYLIGAIGLGLLLLLLLTVRKPGIAKQSLRIAVFVSLVWSVLFGIQLWSEQSSATIWAAESLRLFGWLLFLSAVIKQDTERWADLLRRPLTLVALSVPMVALVLSVLFLQAHKWLLLIFMLGALEVLVLLETLYRQAGEHRWQYKPLVVYLGATAVFDFVMFADATMVNQLDADFVAARGYLYACLLPLLVVAVRRIKHWGIEIFISRDVVLHSTLLLVAGAYLFLMALIGYVIKYVGGTWSDLTQILLVFLSLTLLAALLLSNSFRTRIKVFITKHFFANQYDYREEWVKLTESLTGELTQLPEAYAKALQAFAAAIDYGSGHLLRAKEGKLLPLAHLNQRPLSDAELQLLQQVLGFLQSKPWIIDLDEVIRRPFNYEGLRIDPGQLKRCSFQLILPLYRNQQLWGLVLLAPGSEHNVTLDWELRDYLSAVTAQIGNYLFHNEAATEVAENAQFAAFNRMSAFVVHDLKNVLAQIQLILSNAAQHKDNPEFIADTFETLEHTQARMQKMLKQLTDKERLSDTAAATHADIGRVLREIVEGRCCNNRPIPRLQVQELLYAKADSEKLANVLYHLIDNAQQATADNGAVTIEANMNDNDFVHVKITDTGTGMSEDFIANRLFKPFDTTKGNAGMGIGAYDAKNYIEKIGGQLIVESLEGQGTTFTLLLPAVPASIVQHQ